MVELTAGSTEAFELDQGGGELEGTSQALLS
jgi:hypothetical protein